MNRQPNFVLLLCSIAMLSGCAGRKTSRTEAVIPTDGKHDSSVVLGSAFDFNNPSALSKRALVLFDDPKVSPSHKAGLNRSDLQIQQIVYSYGRKSAEVSIYSPSNLITNKPGSYTIHILTITISDTGQFVNALPGTSFFFNKEEADASTKQK